jgi:hypothetical protein
MAKYAWIAGALVAVAAPVLAQGATAPKSQQIATTDTSDANRIVCKKEEKVGTRLGAKKVCLTVKEWEDLAKGAREDTESWQRLAPVSPSS